MENIRFLSTKHFVLTIRFRNFCRETVLLPIAFSIVYCSCMLVLSPVCVCVGCLNTVGIEVSKDLKTHDTRYI